MIVVIGFCTRDQDLMLRNARWWNELGGCKGHELLGCYDPRCDPGVVELIRAEMEKCFFKIHRVTDVKEENDWPQGANYFFRLSCTWLQNKPQYPYFFWMEPDAIPIQPGWVDTLEAEYKRGGKPFMGDRVEVQVEGKEVPLHMSGVAFYENPIYLHAGEAYRAHDVAWDMAAKDQIVPLAHWTDLIEHAWKHPGFKDQFELNTQIAKETILFHSSKDGSLIDRLREKAASVHNQNSVATEPTSDVSSREEIGTRPAQPPPVYDIFIRTYPGDYQWLEYCLKSIKTFVTGFRKVWIVSPSPMPEALKPFLMTLSIDWKVMTDETEDGYLAQQITKLYADVITDYQADYILHVDSDVIFKRSTTPGDFFKDGKLIWYYTPYSEIQTPWQPIIEKFTVHQIPMEYMRRLPMMVPRWLYPKLREFCHGRHGSIISDYIKAQPMRAFSEFNALGAYAHITHPEHFHWVNTIEQEMPEPFAKQFHSWSGFTDEVREEVERILGGGGTGSVTPPSQIKELPSGVWVLEGDQISDWVIQEGRLDHDQNLLPVILRHIRPGDTVVDAGAFIGDHTIAYSNAVGQHGLVLAYEPNPIAFKCLKHNIGNRYNVVYFETALGDTPGEIPLSGNNGNAGGCYAGEHMKIADVPVRTLDHQMGDTPVHFIKIDVEGYELKVLCGAEGTINKCQPTMVIEINSVALERQGATPDHVFGWLTQHLYGWKIIEENALRNDPLYNIIALPAVDKPGSAQVTAETPAPERIDVSASMLTPSPQASLLTLSGIKEYVRRLKAFSNESPRHKAAVSQQLVYAKLRAPNKKARRKRKRAVAKREV